MCLPFPLICNVSDIYFGVNNVCKDKDSGYSIRRKFFRILALRLSNYFVRVDLFPVFIHGKIIAIFIKLS